MTAGDPIGIVYVAVFKREKKKWFLVKRLCSSILASVISNKAYYNNECLLFFSSSISSRALVISIERNEKKSKKVYNNKSMLIRCSLIWQMLFAVFADIFNASLASIGYTQTIRHSRVHMRAIWFSSFVFFLSFRSVFLCVFLPISCVQIEKFSSFTLYIAIWPHSLNAWSMILCRDESYSWLCSKRLKAKSIVALRFHLLFDVLLTLILVQVDFIAHLHLWVRCKLIFWLFVSFNKPLYLFYWLLSVWISTKRAKSSQQQRK